MNHKRKKRFHTSMEQTMFNQWLCRYSAPLSLHLLSFYSLCPCSQSAQTESAVSRFDGWIMAVVIAAVLAGIAWVSMSQKQNRESITDDQILLDLNEKLEKGLISKNEYERRRRNLDM
ncbi:MAG: hypothetical protein JW915_10910 [Chitinispirillaceae bacterium]|nr:hypothetical protein [Chitinispirillaceae bacterium]